jgi:hypothetical protein
VRFSAQSIGFGTGSGKIQFIEPAQVRCLSGTGPCREGVAMAQASKNARTSSATQKFSCPCGGEIRMKAIFENGKMKNIAECEKCKRHERRPSDFK